MKLQDVVSSLKDQQDRMQGDEVGTFNQVCDAVVELSCALDDVPWEQRELVDHLLRTFDDAAHSAYGLAITLAARQGCPPTV